MQLKDKKILVTGAARGIGFAVVKACLAEGAHVFATDIDNVKLAKAAARLKDFKHRLLCHPMDIGDDDSVQTAVKSIAKWDALHGLVNNAAVLDINNASTLAASRLNAVLDVNLTGAIRVTQAVLSKLQNANCSAIVNTLSTQAFYSVPNSAAYATAKGGLLMLTRSMAVDFADADIRVNGVAPGFIDTRMALTEDGGHEHEHDDFVTHYIKQGRIPLRRPGTPEDCAGAFVFLLSNSSHYITGQVICVDGGLTATY